MYDKGMTKGRTLCHIDNFSDIYYSNHMERGHRSCDALL